MQFQGLGIVNERRELFLRLRYTSHSSTCVATLVIPLKLRILNLIPFHASDAESLSGNYPCIQDRLTRRQLLFLRNPWRLLPSLDVVAVSQAPSPESNPNPPSPVTTMVGLYPTIES